MSEKTTTYKDDQPATEALRFKANEILKNAEIWDLLMTVGLVTAEDMHPHDPEKNTYRVQGGFKIYPVVGGL